MEKTANPPIRRECVSVAEAAVMLGLSLSGTYAVIARKEIRSIRLGRRIVIPRRHLEKLLDEAGAAGQAA